MGNDKWETLGPALDARRGLGRVIHLARSGGGRSYIRFGQSCSDSAQQVRRPPVYRPRPGRHMRRGTTVSARWGGATRPPDPPPHGGGARGSPPGLPVNHRFAPQNFSLVKNAKFFSAFFTDEIVNAFDVVGCLSPSAVVTHFLAKDGAPPAVDLRGSWLGLQHRSTRSARS
jgi:hypothetical protein